MNLNIETLNKLTEQHYKLLLEADPNEKLISKYLPELFIPSKKVVSFHVFQKLTTFDLAYYVLRL